ncbi:MAG: hypothetical protein EON58_04015 [Alphaproteobacteria bacterium]|nr:MAG: hypothetical protein EON58_04015 [Alphaproteobacteria bacterium]
MDFSGISGDNWRQMGRRKSTNSVEISRVEHDRFRFVVAARDASGKRSRSYFIGKREAEQFAARKRQELESSASVLDLTEGERAGVVEARAKGIDLREAVAAAVRLAEARQVNRTTVAECYASWIKEMHQAGRRPRYIATLQAFFGRILPKWEGVMVADVSPEMVGAEIHGTGARGKALSEQTKVNARRMMHGFFAYAVGQEWRPDNPVLKLMRTKAKAGSHLEVAVLTPEQSRRLIAAAAEHEPDLLPAVAIGLFAGLRSGELERLSWGEVWLERGLIVVTAGKAKTSSRRMVTIEPCLAALLEGRRPANAEEPVWPLNGQRMWDRAIKAAGWRGQLHWNPKPAPNTQAPPWPANAMRHSFVSYHVAAFGDPARTAMEAGHSVEVLHRHYRQLVSQAEGEEYWTAGIVV